MFREIINKSPDFIKSPAKKIYNSIPDSVKYGKVFNETYDFLQDSQWWSKEKLEEYQMNEIIKILNHSYENVPYYRRVFDERGFKPNHIQDFNDLKKIPYLTKEIIQNNLNDLIAENYNKKNLICINTGGSTGIPMNFYEDKKISDAREWAFTATLWSRIGYKTNKKNKCVILRGHIPKNKLYEYKGKDLILSSFNLTNENISLYLDIIKEFDPDFIQSYPSSISIISDYIIENKLNFKLKKLKAIICASENIYDFQRSNIEQAFKVRVYSFYGHSEHACMGGECEKSNYYHLQSEYGFTELINEDGEDVKGEDEVGEIVATGFNNYVMPFIRYKTCDMAVNTNEICSCGRNYKLIKKVEGRKQDYFIDKNGYKVIFTWADYPFWNIKDKIFAYQYIQNEPGKVNLIIESKQNLNFNDYKYIKQDFLNIYPNFEIELNEVNHIKRTKGGKFRYLIQNIEN